MRRALVDTSVFVDFLRDGAAGRLEVLLRNNSVLLSGYVRLELMMGVRRDEVDVLERMLGGIPQVPHKEEVFAVAEAFALRMKTKGLNVGLVDLLIAAQARMLGARVMSSDHVFERMAQLGLVELESR